MDKLDNKNKAKTIAIDIFSGAFAACCVAPGIAMIDQAVTEKAADKSIRLFPSALQNLKSLFKTPRAFLTKPTFLFVCLVYGGTYVTANTISSLCEFAGKDPFWMKLGGTTAVNMTLGILKDKYFAQVFSGKPVTKFPLSSWSLFVVRDTLTIAAAFNLPSLVSSELQRRAIIPSKSLADKITLIGVPMVAQLFLTPIHLLALDFYNNKLAPLKSRATIIGSIYAETTSIRMGRVLCAYGIAGVANIGFRKYLREEFLEIA